jgi:hypothetical protein
MGFGAIPDNRKPGDPFAKTTPTGPSADTETRNWGRARRGLALVQAGYFFALLAVLGGAGVYIASLLGVKLPTGPALTKVPEFTQATEIQIGVIAIPAVLAALCLTLGRFGVARTPHSSYAKGLFQASALTTLMTLLGLVAFGAIMVSQLAQGISPKLLLADELPGIIQRAGIAVAGVFAPLAELWFVIALGRLGSGLRHATLSARGTRFLIMAGFVFIVVCLCIYGFSFYRSDAMQFITKEIEPKLEPLGDKKALLVPGSLILAGLVVWLLYFRLVGAARGAIREVLGGSHG